MSPTQCLILAGGLATRLRPLTEKIPKALIEINGKPFLDYQLRHLKNTGVSHVVLSIGYRGEMIEEAIGDGERFGLQIDYVSEGKNLLGTGGAIRLAVDQGVMDEEFLITYGDSYLPVDFGAILSSFREGEDPAMLVVYKNEDRWDVSNTVFDGKRVTLYDKRPESKSQDMKYIDYGISAFRRSAILERIPSAEKRDLSEMVHQLCLEGKLAGYEVYERFYEIGSHAGLEEFQDLVIGNRL